MTCMLSWLGLVSASTCKRKRIDAAYNKELSWAFGASCVCGMLSVTYVNPISQTAWKKLTSLGAGAQVNKGMPLPGAPKALARSCSCARGVDNRYKYVDCHGSERMNFSFLYLSFFSLLSVSWLRKPIFGSLKAACSLSANGRTLPCFEVKQACSLL